MAQNSEVINFEALSEDRVTLATKWATGTPFFLIAKEKDYYLRIDNLKKEDGSNQKFLFEATAILIEPNGGHPPIRKNFKYKGYFDNNTKTGWIQFVG